MTLHFTSRRRGDARVPRLGVGVVGRAHQRADRRVPEAQRLREAIARLGASAAFWVIESRSMEERRYGCRAKKVTSCHIDAVTGQISPCPLFPYSSQTCRLGIAERAGGLLDALRDPFFVAYRAGHAGSRHCSRDLEAELEQLLANPGLGAADRRQVESRLERATTSTR